MAGNKILIIEDEIPLQKGAEIVMRENGFEVITASDGKTGLEKAKTEAPDLILLDIMLQHMNGFQILEQLKGDDAYKHIPIIMLTNLGQEEDKQRSAELGADGYYVKSSTDLYELADKIKEVLGSKGEAQPSAPAQEAPVAEPQPEQPEPVAQGTNEEPANTETQTPPAF